MSDNNADWKKFKDAHMASDENDDMDEDMQTTPTGVLDHPSYRHLEEKLTLAEQKAHENWEKCLRTVAELENVRRRAERDVANAHKYSLEKFVNALLPVGDSLEQALQLVDKSGDAAMHNGMDLTMKLFLSVLEKFDVQQIDPLHKAFDPQQHEAMTMQESREFPPNTVLAVFQKGYVLHDRVIRPARVVVSKEK